MPQQLLDGVSLGGVVMESLLQQAQAPGGQLAPEPCVAGAATPQNKRGALRVRALPWQLWWMTLGISYDEITMNPTFCIFRLTIRLNFENR